MKAIIEGLATLLCLVLGKHRLPRAYRLPLNRRLMAAMLKDGKV